MNCLNCKEPMVVLELNQVEIDYCLECGGIWLDGGELEILIEDPAEVKKMLADFASGRESASGKRKCPVCRKKMEMITIGDKNKVQIDRCVRHHGIWFDKNELDEVIEIFDQNKNSRVHKLLKEMFNK
ncbi:conserved hypothetical protein [Candidatus Zixiibacteriota bacterium]|nr:conserved hypothetical protein [candidate division Zixibacteria bacterium]